MRLASFLLVLCAGSAALAQERNFVACPIVRDTKTLPCFLAEYAGVTYFLGTQQEFGSGVAAPQLKHEVLVEGTVASGPRVCGGVPLDRLSVSVLKEVNLACNVILPAEPGIDAPMAIRKRSQSLPAADKPEFSILFSYDDATVDSFSTAAVTQAADYAKRSNASLTVTGYRGSAKLSSGTTMTEKSGLAEKRAAAVAALLRSSGVSQVRVESKDEVSSSDPSARRVTISAR